MSSILAFSACHLAYMTGSKETENLFYHHRVVAIKGLQKAISSFSKENCDAILAASMLLSWQTTEWLVHMTSEVKGHPILTHASGGRGHLYRKVSHR